MNHELSKRLREERSRLGISQTALASYGGVSKSSQILYESGKRSPDSDYLVAVAAAGVDVCYVLFGERKMTQVDTYLNTMLLSEIIDAVDTWASQRQQPVPSQTKGELVTLFYRQFQGQSIDLDLMSRHLKLVG